MDYDRKLWDNESGMREYLVHRAACRTIPPPVFDRYGESPLDILVHFLGDEDINVGVYKAYREELSKRLKSCTLQQIPELSGLLYLSLLVEDSRQIYDEILNWAYSEGPFSTRQLSDPFKQSHSLGADPRGYVESIGNSVISTLGCSDTEEGKNITYNMCKDLISYTKDQDTVYRCVATLWRVKPEPATIELIKDVLKVSRQTHLDLLELVDDPELLREFIDVKEFR
jgi:hypothetical protein